MAKIKIWTCANKCYFRDRIWEEGDKFQGTVANKHFIDQDGNRGEDVKIDADGKKSKVSAEIDPDKLTESERNSAMLAALNKLDHSNDEHWTSKGLPAMEAVEEFLGFRITRDELKASFPHVVRDDL